MFNDSTPIQLPLNHTFNVSIDREDPEAGKLCIRDEKGNTLAEMDVPAKFIKGVQNLAPWVRKMFLQEFYATPKAVWGENHSTRVLSYLKLLHDRMSEERLTLWMGKRRFFYRVPFTYVVNGIERTGYIARKRESHELVIATYSFMLPERNVTQVTRMSPSDQIPGTITFSDAKVELKFMEHCSAETGIPTGEEMYEKYKSIIDATYQMAEHC